MKACMKFDGNYASHFPKIRKIIKSNSHRSQMAYALDSLFAAHLRDSKVFQIGKRLSNDDFINSIFKQENVKISHP